MTAPSATYLLLNPFGVTVRSFDSPEELEAYIVRRFGGTDADSMNGHRGVRRTRRT